MADAKKLMGVLRSAKTMTFAQVAIEKMQIALKKGEAALNRAVERGKKLIEEAKKRESDARMLKIDLVSNYADAAKYFRDELANVDGEALELENYQKQIRRIEPFLTDDQKNIVAEWAKMKTGVDLKEIDNIREFLAAKGHKVEATPAQPAANRKRQPAAPRQTVNA